MNSDSQQKSDAGRRKFDDVTSLFGTIVPPAGTPVRPPASLYQPEPEIVVAPPEPPPVAEPARPKPARPPALRRVDPPKTRPPGPSGQQQPTRRPKAAKSAAPFADGFAPRPNWRRQGTSRSWSWLLLVPIAAVVAIGIATLDPKSIRDFVDRVVFKIQPPIAADIPSLLPGAFRPGAATSSPAPQIQSPTAASQARPIPVPTDTPSPEAAVPAQAAQDTPPAVSAPSAPEATAPADATPQPTAPEATRPQLPAPQLAAPQPTMFQPAEPQPADVEPAPSVAPASVAVPDPPALARVTITYRAGNAASEAEARRLAAKIGQGGAAVDLRSSATTVRAPALVYHNAADKDAATALVQSLAETGVRWTVRLGPSRGAGSAEIVVP